MKYNHCLKVCEMAYKITKYFSIYKIEQTITCCIILSQIQSITKEFFYNILS